MFAQLLVLLAIIVALLATVSEAWFYGGFGYPWYGGYGLGFGGYGLGFGGYGLGGWGLGWGFGR